MNLEEQLVSILSQHCGERGQTEGAVDTLERILREKTDLEAKVCVMREALTILAGLPDSEGTTHTAELHDVTHAARFVMEALSSVPACIHKEELVELRRANQKAAGYRVDRCACVFPDDNDDPSQECGYHKNLREQLAILQAALDGANRWHDNDTNVIVIAATNRPDVLDPALLRPGRFDRTAVIDQPDIADREAIIKIHSRNKPLSKDVNLRAVAERTPGFTGADLENLVNEAAILTARHNKKIISQQDLLVSIEKVMLGPERKGHVLSKKEKAIAAHHEAGHALVAAVLPHADPVHKISIISRGRAAGYTLKLPMEDKHLHSRSEFLADIAVSMGGLVAEKLVFNEMTTGASNDLKVATDLAHKMVTAYGMSDRLGPMTFGNPHEMVFLGRELGEQENYSEKIATKIDEEIRVIIDQCYKSATDIIKKFRSKLTEIAEKLIEQETIEREEFEKMIQDVISEEKRESLKMRPAPSVTTPAAA